VKVNATARSACAALLALAALSAAADEPGAPADGGASTSWAYDLANDLMSPFCPGRSLADCPSPDAASLRMWILVQAAAGRTRDDVEQELYARYGEVIRAAPKAEGWGLAAYWIPAGVFAGGGALVAWFLHRSTQRARTEEPPVRPLDPEVERKLDELLGRDEDEADPR
jgi:cytochrome c-type biogenesis protein CcmH/NrfF